jgi:hypothetical protein
VKRHNTDSSHILLSKKFCLSTPISFAQVKCGKSYGIRSENLAFCIVLSNCGTAEDVTAPEIPNYVTLQNALQFLKASAIPATSNTAKPLRWLGSFDSFQTEARGIVRKTNRTAGAVSSTGTDLTGLHLISAPTEQHTSSS